MLHHRHFPPVTAVPPQVQVTMRFNQEVMWAADEDYQLVLSTPFAEAGQNVSLSRALDLHLSPH